MSKLGKIYKINIDQGIKEQQPVIYRNKKYFYCKVHGDDRLHMHESNYVYPYEEFKKGYEKGEVYHAKTYYVHVPVDIKTFFEWVKEKTPIELEIERLKRAIDYYDSCIANRKSIIERHSQFITDYERDKQWTQQKLQRLYERLAECEEDESCNSSEC